ncbi:MAG: 50S ribosomal protein L11 methyltransferase [Eubacteriales bacterium]
MSQETDLSWLEITVSTTTKEIEETCAQLAGGGMTALVIEEEEDFLQFLEENRQYWDYVDEQLLKSMKGVARVKFYVTNDDNGAEQLKEHTKLLTFPYEVTELKEKDWAYSWQKYYKPLEIGANLYIVPEWERENPLPLGKIPCYLNPGLTFGTGAHASTQLCLESVEAHTKKGDRVLDLGCGSGILSIMALILGAKSAIALDIDPITHSIATENAQFNNITSEQYTVLIGDVLSDHKLREQISQEKYPLIFANIVADVILALAPLVKELLADKGIFLCSGIIDNRGEEVIEALEKEGFSLVKKREKNGWIALEWCLYE